MRPVPRKPTARPSRPAHPAGGLAHAFALSLLLGAPAAGAGVLRGTVHVPPAPRDEAMAVTYPGRANALVCRRRPVRGAVTDAVVYVESVPAAVDSALPAPPRPKLAQKDQAFEPRVVVVPAGGEVDFPNLDPIYHNVFSVSPVRRFDLGKYPRGESRTVRFPRPGLVNVYCDIHSDMAGFIVVLPHRVFARPREGGAFELPDLPPGRYALVWWHPDFAGGRREIEIGAGDPAPVDVEFTP